MIDLNKRYDIQNTSKFKKILLIAAGYLLIGLGIIGIVLPVMPSTIFFILAAACFLRSSQKNYDRLVNNSLIGKYIKNYIERRGMTPRSKMISISFLWLTLVVSILFFVNALWLKGLLFLVGIGVTIHISKLKTLRTNGEETISKHPLRAEN